MKIKNLDELIGKRVVVTADAGTLGYMIAQRHLDARRLAAVGVVEGWVPGHGGDVVHVRHEDAQPGAEPVGVYCHLNELEFYSETALAFARDKADKVRILKRQLSGLQLTPFCEPVVSPLAHKCDICGKPATSAAADTFRHEVPGESYVTFSPTGDVRYGCDEHPAEARSTETLTMMPRAKAER